jgi:hypothetical protein
MIILEVTTNTEDNSTFTSFTAVLRREKGIELNKRGLDTHFIWAGFFKGDPDTLH